MCRFYLVNLFLFFLFRAGAAVGAAATANAGGLVAAGGAALSAGAGAVASAASAFFSSVSGSGEGASSGAPTGGLRPPSSTGTRPKRKVILAYIFKPCFMYALIYCRPCSEAWSLIRFFFQLSLSGSDETCRIWLYVFFLLQAAYLKKNSVYQFLGSC